MYHKQLVTHVTDKLRRGTSQETITKELSEDGWSKDDITEAFHYSMNPEELRHFSFMRLLHSEVSVAFTSAIIILVIASAVLFSFFGPHSANYRITLPTPPGRSALAFTYGAEPAFSNPDFFTEVKQKFIDKKADFIETDLSTMIVRVYKKGNVVLEVPVKTKGREGSWWETPAGLYKISSKEDDHFSSLGKVHQPWSMAFQGNFFIHGWPYYDGGKPVASTYSGGCIRLDTEDAKKVFDLVDIDTPILVYEKDFSSDNYTYTEKTPEVSAVSYLVADLRNNQVFTKQDPDSKVPIASITKLVTALIATEYLNLDAVATVPAEAIIKTSKPRLTAGNSLSIYQLLLPLLMESSNEAAETIARHYGRSNFIKKMNEKAASIGMLHTHFDDPSGISPGNTSTGNDLFMLAKYIYNNRRFIFDLTAGKTDKNAYGKSQFTDLSNFNDFVGNPDFIGGKNGKTEAAKETGISVFELPVGSTKRPIVLIILGSNNEKDELHTLLEYTNQVLQNHI